MIGTISDPIHEPETEPENPPVVLGLAASNSSISVSMSSKSSDYGVIFSRDRPTRACTTRPPRYLDPPRRPRPVTKEVVEEEVVEDVCSSEDENDGRGQNGKCKKVVTSLVNVPNVEQVPRWKLRSMWELASILNFFHVFWPLLNIRVEFSAEELESALLTPNGTLADVHIPLLKAIPPVPHMACGRDTWVTVLCRKLRDWWQWVAEGELPVVSSKGAEMEAYKNLDPSVRVVILKALCDIRVEQDDIRSYIDDSIKHGAQLSAFRKVRIGGDSHGISYWYEDDELIGHRLYREIKKVEVKAEAKKEKNKGSHVLYNTSFEWETVATNLDEFVDVSEKLFASSNRTEVSLGKKLKNDMLPEIEKIHKRREKLVKKQQRQALLLDSFVTMDGLGPGRSLRDRKPVTYTFDDFDNSINEALKVTKRKQPSPEPRLRREVTKSGPSANDRLDRSSRALMDVSFKPLSRSEFDAIVGGHKSGPLDRSSRQRQKPQRYSEKEFVRPSSDIEEDIDAADDDIMEDHDDYRKHHKQKNKATSSSEGEGDEEYHCADENGDNDVDEEEEDSSDGSEESEDSDQLRGRRYKETKGRTRRGITLGSNLRRSKRSTRNNVDYHQYESSDSETESSKRKRINTYDDEECSMGSRDSDESNEEHRGGSDQSRESDESNKKEYQEIGVDQSILVAGEKVEIKPLTVPECLNPNEPDGVRERRFLDLNELAPAPDFLDEPSSLPKDHIGKTE